MGVWYSLDVRRRARRFLATCCSALSQLICLAALVGWRTGVSERPTNLVLHKFDRRLFGAGRVYIFADRRVIGIGVLTAGSYDAGEVHANATDSQGNLCNPAGFGVVR